MAGEYNTIDVYVEVGGKEKYHESLRGRDEVDQHPIAAITNLQEALDGIDEKFEEVEQELQQNIDNLEGRINSMDEFLQLSIDDINQKIADISGGTTEKIDEISNKVDEMDKTLDTKLTEVDTQLAEMKQAIEQTVTEIDDKIDNKVSTAKQEIEEEYSNVIKWKGSVRTFDYLPKTGQVVGDMYNVEDTDDNYFWTGLAWDKFAGHTSHEEFATKEYVDGSIKTLTEAIDAELDSDYYNRTQTDNLLKEVMNFRGVLPHKSDLDSITPKAGYFYKVTENNQSYIGTGTEWLELCGAAETYTKEQIDALLALKADKEQLTKVEEEITTLAETVEGLDNDIEQLNTSVEDIKGDITTITNNIDTINNDITVINSDITGLKEHVDGLDESIEGIEQDIELKADKTELENVVRYTEDSSITINNIISDNLTINGTDKVITSENLKDVIKAGTGIEIDKEDGAYTISITEESVEPVVETVVTEKIGEVKQDVQTNKEAIEILDEQVKELKWKTLEDVLGSST